MAAPIYPRPADYDTLGRLGATPTGEIEGLLSELLEEVRGLRAELRKRDERADQVRRNFDRAVRKGSKVVR